MDVLNKKLVSLIALVLCIVVVAAIRTSYRQYVAPQYKGDGKCTYLKRVGLLGSDGYEITFEDFSLGAEYKASYVLKGMPMNDQAYEIALQVDDCSRGFDGLDNSMLAIRLSDDMRRVYFDVNDRIQNYAHAYPPFHLYYYNPNSDPVFTTIDVIKDRAYIIDVHYIPSGVDSNTTLRGHIFLKSGGFK